MSEDATQDTPQLNEALEGKAISFDAAKESCRQADADADEREDVTVAWDEVIETPTRAVSIDTFKDRAGETFEVDLGHFRDRVELVEINPLGAAAETGDSAGSRAPFELVFKDLTERTRLPEGIYRLHHEKIGDLELYLMPEGANHMRLIATFC